MKQSTSLDFTGQSFYVGIDTHKTNWKVTIRCANMVIKQFSMDPDPEKLQQFMEKYYPNGTYHSVYEAGFGGFWMHRELVRLGIRNIIVNPADVPTTNKEKDRKSDPIDSNKLSRELSSGSLCGIYVPDAKMESMRVLSRCLRQYTNRSTQVKNRIKALLLFTGVKCEMDSESHWSRAYINHLSNLEFNEELEKYVLNQHLKELVHIRELKLDLLRKIRSISLKEPAVNLLRSIPGLGFITAFALFAELVDITRFPNLDKLVSYVGLVPSMYSSDDKTVVRGITNRHCAYLRYMLIEAAWVIVRKDPVMTAYFTRLSNGKDKDRKKKAIIRVAKKLMSRVRAVWLSQKPYVIGTIETENVAFDNDEVSKLIVNKAKKR
jgi:transposase